MARKCEITGTGPLAGNNVSHAHNKTKRRQLPNLQNKRIYVEELDQYVRVKLTARAMKTVTKKGLVQYLREQGMTIQDIM